MSDRPIKDASSQQSLVERAADRLIGQCLEDYVQVFEEMGIEETQENCEELDTLAFCCAGCGWWCEAGEANENPDGDGDLCDDCKEDDDED